MIKVKKGLNLPITGEPAQKIETGNSVSKVALLGDDIVGMKPTMAVKVGDKVKLGQLLYEDKKTPGIRYTSPAAGEVLEVNRGEKRAFQSVVVKVEGDDAVSFSAYKGSDIASYSKEDLTALMVESGAWTSLRARPFSKVANPEHSPSSLFITAIDTHPLAANPRTVIAKNLADFTLGLKALTKLAPKTYLCTDAMGSVLEEKVDTVQEEAFDGPHPAGLVGTHIHNLDPVSMDKQVWHTNYQEVIALGGLIRTGKLFVERVVSIAGPIAKNPRLVKTRVGADLNELTKDELNTDAEARIVSGSVFGGREAAGPLAYLGKFHHQVSLLREGREREFMGWHSPGFDRFSVQNIYLSKPMFFKKFNFSTNGNGSLRSIVPIGSYEKVMPLDIEATYLLRHLMGENLDMCVKLGALELDEEDLSLCTFVDPCKNDFAPKLREKLTIIEKEG